MYISISMLLVCPPRPVRSCPVAGGGGGVGQETLNCINIHNINIELNRSLCCVYVEQTDGRTRQECNECRRAAAAADYVEDGRTARNRTQEACNLRCEEYEKCLMIQLNMFWGNYIPLLRSLTPPPCSGLSAKSAQFVYILILVK